MMNPPSLAMVDRTDRVRVRIAGPDRLQFLNNLTTNDIKRLAVGQGCEAFVTSLQGKTLGYVTVLAGADEILLRSDPGTLVELLPHFRKYGVFDDVSLDDLTPTTCELHLIGSRSGDLVARLGLPEPTSGELGHVPGTWSSRPVLVIREAPAGLPGLTLIGPRELAEAVRDTGAGSDLVALDPAIFEALRIEAGTPVSGRDVTPSNLPQEVGRDRQAICFTKGCYLGQETVARIDALGHVNRLLKGLQLDVPAPPGTELKTADGKAAGSITSSAIVPATGQAIALGYVHVAQARPGNGLKFDAEGRSGTAVVVDLPMKPAAT
jgi:folate-binding protein YgfZ